MSNQESNKFTHTDEKFWDEKWKIMEIPFHQTNLHHYLVKHLDKLINNRSNLKFFFPFCGKAVDMAWIASMGHTVVGIEFVEEALKQFFQEQNLKYSVNKVDDFMLYTSEDGHLRLYAGDYFKFTSKYEGLFDCVWDRGALVALPKVLREAYAPHMLQLLNLNFRYFLDTFNYDFTKFPGPPHMVSIDEIKQLYGSKCKIETIDTVDHRNFADPTGPPCQELLHLLTKLD